MSGTMAMTREIGLRTIQRSRSLGDADSTSSNMGAGLGAAGAAGTSHSGTARRSFWRDPSLTLWGRLRRR